MGRWHVVGKTKRKSHHAWRLCQRATQRPTYLVHAQCRPCAEAQRPRPLAPQFWDCIAGIQRFPPDVRHRRALPGKHEETSKTFMCGIQQHRTHAVVHEIKHESVPRGCVETRSFGE